MQLRQIIRMFIHHNHIKMKLYKFQNKSDRKKMIWISTVSPILILLTLLGFNGRINPYLLFLIMSLLSFIYIMFYVKKSSITIEEIIIQDNSFKFYVFDKRKKPVEIGKNDIVTKIDSGKISFQRSSGVLIGEAHKITIEEPSKWEELINTLNVKS